MTVKTVGLDLAKDVFQVHCVSATGRKIINKKIMTCPCFQGHS